MAPRASADLIFDQTVDLVIGGAVFSDFADVDQRQAADNFLLQDHASTITDIHWWGLYGVNIPQPDDFTIRIFFNPDSEVPQIEFAVGAVNRVDTGVDFLNRFDVFAYSVDIAPLKLAADTVYWLSIVNHTTLGIDDAWLWNTESATNDALLLRNGDGQEWMTNMELGLDAGNAGFQLTNDAIVVPEPATWVLFAAGIAGLGLLARRRMD